MDQLNLHVMSTIVSYLSSSRALDHLAVDDRQDWSVVTRLPTSGLRQISYPFSSDSVLSPEQRIFDPGRQRLRSRTPTIFPYCSHQEA